MKGKLIAWAVVGFLLLFIPTTYPNYCYESHKSVEETTSESVTVAIEKSEPIENILLTAIASVWSNSGLPTVEEICDDRVGWGLYLGVLILWSGAYWGLIYYFGRR